MDKASIKKDLNEFGVSEILAQYMANPNAEEVVLEYIQDLEESKERWKNRYDEQLEESEKTYNYLNKRLQVFSEKLDLVNELTRKTPST
jgi:hypothetical protein